LKILGISAYYHDSAAALVVDGDIVAAAQEERFTRKKHDFGFPGKAIQYCLAEAGIGEEDLDYVVYYEKPLQKFDRLLETYLAFAPRGFRSFCQAIPLWLKEKLHLPRDLRRGLNERYDGPIVFTEHHESHAASAFFPSSFDEAAIVTMDGVGEWATASVGRGQGNRIEIFQEMHFPHSVGLLYSAFTYYCGFRVNSGEYKLMGLAPYGEPKYKASILENIVEVKDDGSIWMDMSYFNYCQGSTMTSEKFHRLFGGAPRRPEVKMTQQYMDLAASIQEVTEDVMLKMCRHAKERTGCRNLCLAGGVALNCVGNGKILRSGDFDNVWIQPAAGDAGGALGGALFLWYQLLENARDGAESDRQTGSLLGPGYGENDIRDCLDDLGAEYTLLDSDDELLDRVSTYIAGGKVVGWFQGRMEFGPRALGSRSILGDARSQTMQSIMNRKIKFRESFRPFAPSVLREHTSDHFEIEEESPYMLLVADVREEHRTKLSDDEKRRMAEGDIRERVHMARSTIPAITHLDYSARVQTVDEKRHGRYYHLIRRFHDKTACPVIINTSFNIRGEPIVCTPRDAYNCFMNTEMDVLVLERFVLMKDDQQRRDDDAKEGYRKEFPLD